MGLPISEAGFTGPLRIDIALRFETLGGGPSQPFVALGAEGETARLTFGQLEATDDLLFELVQGGTIYQLVAPDALVPGETAVFTAEIDDSGQMAVYKDDAVLAQMQGKVPLDLPIDDLRGPDTPFDPSVTDLTIEPISPAALGGNIVVVAHPDDDLLFMNPTIAEEIAAGETVTAVYLTAGDAGQDAPYWEGREEGAKAAYALMAGTDRSDWVDETVTLSIDGAAAEVASSYLASAPEVRLYFLRTPDGIDGGGTPTYGLGSLEQLWDGSITDVTTVDGAVTYSATDLTQVIGAIMTRHAPEDLLLQDDTSEIEHSDHVHTADFAEAALPIFDEDITVTRYQSYNSWGEEENLSPEDVALVTQVFEAYAAFDPSVVDDAGAVREPYTDWVLREYVTERYELVDGERVDLPLSVDPTPVDPEPVDPDPVDPDPEEPTPVDPPAPDPVPEDPAPVDPPAPDPVPEDPAPVDPPAPDPGPVDPTPTDPAPTAGGDWTSGLYGSDGVFGQFLSGSFWGSSPPTPTAPSPTEPTPAPPADPTPVDPAPSGLAGFGAFGAGGLYDLFLSGNEGKWATATPPETPETPAPTPAPEPTPTGGGTSTDPFAPGGFYESLMRADDEKWDALDAMDEAEETDDPLMI